MNDDLHARAMALFDEARLLELRGDREAARETYEAAAVLDEQCVETIRDEEPRSRWILSIRAVSLWMHTGQLDKAESLVRRYGSSSLGPGFQRELLELLSEIRRKRDGERAAPVEPDERGSVLVDALRKAEEDLGARKVRLWAIKGAA